MFLLYAKALLTHAAWIWWEFAWRGIEV